MDKNVKRLLMESAIRLVAQNGLENTRTKQITDACEYAESTLYRYYKGKDDILLDAFLAVDRRVSALLDTYIHLAGGELKDFDRQVHSIWHIVYRYLIDHKEETLFLIRYRYSSYYTDEVRSRRRAHSGAFSVVYDQISQQFGIADIETSEFILNYSLEIMLCFAERIIAGRMPDNADTEQKIWRVAKGAIMGFLKKE